MPYKRTYSKTSMGKRGKYRYSRSKRTRYQGLVPTYRGFVPRRFQQGEWKYLDVAISGAVDTTGAVYALNVMQLGNTASTRVGMKISIRSIEIRVYNQATPATGIDQVHRMYLMVDRQTNGVGPTAVTDYFSAANIYGLRQLANRKRFKCILDKTIYLCAAGEANSGRFRKFYLKLRRPLVVEYNTGNAGNVSDIVSNFLFLGFIGNVVAGGTAGSSAGYARIRYTDM